MFIQPPLPQVPFHLFDSMPVGAVIAFAGRLLASGQSPEVGHTDVEQWGWMLCDGRTLPIGRYPELYSVLGNLYGGDGRQTFAIPDYLGTFLRGVDDGSGNDPDLDTRTPPANGRQGDPGSTQKCALQKHEHHYVEPLEPAPSQEGEGVAVPAIDPEGITTGILQSDGIPLQNVSNSETRPKNIYVNYLIKFAYQSAYPVAP